MIKFVGELRRNVYVRIVVAYSLCFAAMNVGRATLWLLVSHTAHSALRHSEYLFYNRLVDLAAVIFVVAILLKAQRKPFLESVGLARAGAIQQTAIGFAIGLVMVASFVGVTLASGWYRINSLNHSFPWAYALPYALFPIAGMQLFFLGHVFQQLKERSGRAAAVIGSAALYGVASVIWINHFSHYAGPIFVSCLISELALASAFNLTQKLWLPIGMQWAWDFGLELIVYQIPLRLMPFFIGRIRTGHNLYQGIYFWVAQAIHLAAAVVFLLLARRKYRRTVLIEPEAAYADRTS